MEVWKTVIVNGEIYNNYMVSNLGNVKSLKFGKEKMLRLRKDKGNYLYVDLCKNGKPKKYLVHRLVAEAFLTKIPGKDFVDHINGIRDDNRIDNLRWCSQAENNNFDLYRKHRSETSVWKGKTGVLHNSSKAVLCIELNRIFGSIAEAERELGINHTSISMCCLGKRNSAGKLNGEKLHWRYI